MFVMLSRVNEVCQSNCKNICAEKEQVLNKTVVETLIPFGCFELIDNYCGQNSNKEIKSIFLSLDWPFLVTL